MVTKDSSEKSLLFFFLWALFTKLIELKQFLLSHLVTCSGLERNRQKWFPLKSSLKYDKVPKTSRTQLVSLNAYQLFRFTLTANLSLRSELFIDKWKAGKFILIDAPNDVVGNRRQHRLLASKFRVKIDSITCTFLKLTMK